jgi:two-component system, OmpR family, sensor histidine kinase MprB
VSFRARLTLVAAAAVALAVVLASAVVYVVVRDQLRGTVDAGLERAARAIPHLPPNALDRIASPRGELGGPTGYPQIVRADGATYRPQNSNVALPVNDRVLAVARGERGTFLTDAHVNMTHVRLLTVPYYPGYAVEVARPLSETDHTLGRLRRYLLAIDAAGIALAAALGLLVSSAALAPVRRLTSATETVTETGDLSERIDARGRDELSRLAGSFNSMLGALEESTRAQQQLVADASHELRTPLTSLRTNIEVLARDRELPEGERERLLNDVVEQLGEMTTLIAELMNLARGEQQSTEPEDVRLDLLAAGAVERARRNRPNVTFTTDFEESFVHGVPATIERAIANLLDNAAKWSPEGGEVDIVVRGGTVTVRDHGPGIDDADLPYVFDRFYRASAARGQPGSGLGLAIVRQVAEAHGGGVVAERAPGGGTRVALRLS